MGSHPVKQGGDFVSGSVRVEHALATAVIACALSRWLYDSGCIYVLPEERISLLLLRVVVRTCMRIVGDSMCNNL